MYWLALLLFEYNKSLFLADSANGNQLIFNLNTHVDKLIRSSPTKLGEYYHSNKRRYCIVRALVLSIIPVIPSTALTYWNNTDCNLHWYYTALSVSYMYISVLYTHKLTLSAAVAFLG